MSTDTFHDDAGLLIHEPRPAYVSPLPPEQRLENIYNRLSIARWSAARTEDGKINGYDNVRGLLQSAEMQLDKSFAFPELNHLIFETHVFLGDPFED